MKRFVVGDDRSQSPLFPERLDEYLGDDNPVRAIDVLVDELDLGELGFSGVSRSATGRPAYHPATLLKWTLLTKVETSCDRILIAGGANVEAEWEQGPAV